MKSKNRFALKCVAQDAEYVTESSDFETVDSAWERANQMGSRWVFYPILVVTTSGPAAIIRGVPEGMPDEWLGKRFASLLLCIAGNQDHAAEYIAGKCPFCIYP